MLSEKFPFLTQENVKDVLTLSFLAAISHMEEKLFDVVLLNLELQENKSRYNKCFITAETSYKSPSVALGSICKIKHYYG